MNSTDGEEARARREREWWREALGTIEERGPCWRGKKLIFYTNKEGDGEFVQKNNLTCQMR